MLPIVNRLDEQLACAVNKSRSYKAEDLLLLPTLLGLVASKGQGLAGTFVELGAFDGVTDSNTFMLQHCFGWKGVLIEASPLNFRMLNQSGRETGATLWHSGVCNSSAGVIKFADGTMCKNQQPCALQTAGAFEFITPTRQKLRRHHTVPVRCRPLSDILRDSSLNGPIDFLSLDVEGSEAKVLQTVDPARFGAVLLESVSAGTSACRRMLEVAGLRRANASLYPRSRLVMNDVWLGSATREHHVAGVTWSREAMKWTNHDVDVLHKPTFSSESLRQAVLAAIREALSSR